MPLQRRLWKPFSCFFLLLISACQPQPAEKTQPTDSPAATSANSLPADTATLTAEPTGNKPVTWHRLARRTNPHAPLLVYNRVARPPASELVASPPPRETRLFDLTRKASQYYRIDATHPAEVRGQEGTVVRIPAGCFVDGQQRAVAGQVWIELKECYSLVDMLLSDVVSETADGQLLTTGGGVFIRASAHGQQLALAPNRTYQVELPVSRQQTGMSLFRGVSAGLQPVRWQETAPADPAPEQIYTTAEQLPTYGKSPTDINKLIRYPKTALARGTQGMVFASFVVDEAGRVRSPRILRGIGDGCDEEVLRVLRQTSGHWTPGQQDGRFVKVKMVVPIRFNPRKACSPLLR
ncbi:energy transducer TonB [Hymenobacter sp. DG25B]|uniref:energy transducer TonB n=1 Tax=Hymenobacter sp. DG25B TaxID=1385664 RepID=UPI0018CF8C49|nr:energy transducer TonB [Hymenobacter sp. DG25B]